MFTGIVEERGHVAAVQHHQTGARLDVYCETVLADLHIGASIAVNGVCLTAVSVQADGFSADLAPETLERSNLGALQTKSVVNLERPLSLNTRLGGHMVQGHVDGTGTLETLKELGDGNWELHIRVPHELQRLLVYKGSVCLDGISLTVASVDEDVIRAAIIPHTYRATNLSSRTAGDRVNIECDILAKHVDQLMRFMHLPLT